MMTIYTVESSHFHNDYNHNHWTELTRCTDFDVAMLFLRNSIDRAINNTWGCSLNINVSKDHRKWTLTDDEQSVAYRIKETPCHNYKDFYYYMTKSFNIYKSDDPSFDEICNDIVDKTVNCKDELELKDYLKNLMVDMQKNNSENYNKLCNLIVKNLNLVKDSEESNNSEE